MADEYISFENALRELKLSHEQLKQMVSQGEIRAVRAEGKSMKFRVEEIDRWKSNAKPAETLTDDLLFDESKDLNVADEGMATAQIGADTTQVGNSGKTAVPAKQEAKPAAKPAQSLRTGRATARSAPAAAAPATASARRSTMRSGPAESDDGSGVGAGMVAALAISSLVCLFAAMVWWDTAHDAPSGATKGISNWAFETFAKK